jgi:hypothetical protein
VTHSAALSNAHLRASKFNRPFAVYLDPTVADDLPELSYYLAAYGDLETECFYADLEPVHVVWPDGEVE